MVRAVVVDPGSGEGLTFGQACAMLAVSSTELASLREQGLVACLRRGSRQVYPREALMLTRRLLSLGRERDWAPATLCWYADLVFAGQIGRTILLPTPAGEAPQPLQPPRSWLETGHVAAVLHDLEALDGGLDPDGPGEDEPLVAVLRSLLAIALGPDQHWPDLPALQGSALYPIVVDLEARGVPTLNQAPAIARDAPQIFMALVLAFTAIAPPLAGELGELVRAMHAKLKGHQGLETAVPAEEQTVITREEFIAVDKFYAGKAPEIHKPPEAWNVEVGIVSAQQRTVALQMRLPDEIPQHTIDNIIDLIRPFLGPYGARVVHLLYEVANDPPYWRNPHITIDTNELLDRLGAKRDRRGVHQSRNRELLRNALNSAHNLEIHAEYTTKEGGRPVRKVVRKTIVSLTGATFDAAEHQSLSTEELFQRGLPKSMNIRLNFYEGVRRPDGRLGNQYVLMPRLAEPKALAKANHAATHELLRAYFLFRYRQTRMKNQTLTVMRQTALEKANIKNKNPRMATQTLRKALDKLVAGGTLEGYSPELPTKPQGTFEVTLAQSAVHTLPLGGDEG